MERRLIDPKVLREIPYVGDPAGAPASRGWLRAGGALTRQRTLASGILSSTWSPAHAAFCAPRLLGSV